MANETIGHFDCPLCGLSADVRVSKKSKAYIQCDDCGFQGFARGFNADKILRGKTKAKAEAPAEAAPVVQVAPKVTPPPVVQNEPKPTPPKAPEKTAAPAPEKTIFDILGF